MSRAALGGRWRGPPNPIRAGRLWRAAVEASPRRSRGDQDLPLRALRSRHAVPSSRSDGRTGLLHQDSLTAGAYLHRPSWAARFVQGPAEYRYLQATAELGLGRPQPERRTASLRYLGCAPTACPALATRYDVGPRGPRCASPRVLRIPAPSCTA